jgi:hypothetical protein
MDLRLFDLSFLLMCIHLPLLDVTWSVSGVGGWGTFCSTLFTIVLAHCGYSGAPWIFNSTLFTVVLAATYQYWSIIFLAVEHHGFLTEHGTHILYLEIINIQICISNLSLDREFTLFFFIFCVWNCSFLFSSSFLYFCFYNNIQVINNGFCL